MKYGLRGDNPVSNESQGGGVKDPVRVRTKGTGRGNQASPSTGRKRQKCSNCGGLGHRRTRQMVHRSREGQEKGHATFRKHIPGTSDFEQLQSLQASGDSQEGCMVLQE
ncbi:hypothetical protein AHAS_Ahas17G0168900 [Arachis hypogaea]